LFINKFASALFAYYRKKVFRRKTVYDLKNQDVGENQGVSETPFF
jgi:hypothetical protein